jgi:Flp pilus assembly pilin Flp
VVLVDNASSQEAATMVEYGFLLSFIAVVVAAAATLLGEAAADFYESVLAWF